MKLIATLSAVITALILSLAGSASAQEGYRIRPGDVLRIEVLEDTSLNRTALVPPDGRITLPLAGTVRAAGSTVESVSAALAERLSSNFAVPPTVFVSIERIAEARLGAGGGVAAKEPVISIFVLGEGAKPGKLDLKPGSTLMQAFAQMGGFSKFAATKRIQLRRTDADGVEKIYNINYAAIVQGRSKSGQTTLQDGDVILVPQRGLFE